MWLSPKPNRNRMKSLMGICIDKRRCRKPVIEDKMGKLSIRKWRCWEMFRKCIVVGFCKHSRIFQG
jgi:hypothetical protein